MTKEEAREAIKEAYGNSEYTDEIIKALEQEPKTGHWTYDRANVRCSNCGKGYKDAFGRTSASTYNYCPMCGAKMFEPQESEDKE